MRSDENNPIRSAIDETLSGLSARPSQKDKVLARVRGEGKPARRPSAALVLALALALALALILLGMACAAVQGGVLDYLLGGGDASRAQQQMVQPVLWEHAGRTVRMAVTDAVLDGPHISLGLDFSSAADAYLLLPEVAVNGETVCMVKSDFQETWLGCPAAGAEAARTVRCGMTVSLKAGPEKARSALAALRAQVAQEGGAQVSVRIVALAPAGEVRTVTAPDDDPAAQWAEIDAILQSGATAVQGDDCRVLGGTAWLRETQGIAPDAVSPLTIPLRIAEDCARYCNMVVVDDYTLSFPLRVPEETVYLPDQAKTIGESFTAEITELSVGPLSLCFTVTLAPQNGHSVQEARALYRGSTLRDAAGTRLAWEASSGVRQKADGTEVWQLDAYVSAPPVGLDAVYLTPADEAVPEGGEASAWVLPIQLR